MKVLVVDDSQVTRGLIIAHLEDIPKQGFEIIEATNGREALHFFEECQPDIMLLDYVLPDISGIEVVQELLKTHPILPIIMVTGFDDVQLAVEATHLGVQGYLLKDRVSADTLLWAIEDAQTKLTMKKQIMVQQKELENFAHTVAHDLKDQISSIQGILGLINSENTDKEKKKNLLQIAIKATGQMQAFVRELLGYAVLQKKLPKKEPFPLDELVREMKIKLHPLIEETDTIINHQTLPIIYGAYTLIYQVVQNLLSNAMHYAGKNLTIKISAEEKDDSWKICIADNGKGIAKEEQEKIFDMFQRGSSAKEKQGTGIGLATCKRIIEDIHGGKIWVESEPKKGAAFCFILPKEVV